MTATKVSATSRSSTNQPGRNFLDTSVLLYAYDSSDAKKRETAQKLLRRAVAGELVISTQVLAEFTAALLHKIVPPVIGKELASLLDALGPIPLIAHDGDMIHRAAEATYNYGMPFYDGLIVAAAERAGCAILWSEDLIMWQEYFGVQIRNPFV